VRIAEWQIVGAPNARTEPLGAQAGDYWGAYKLWPDGWWRLASPNAPTPSAIGGSVQRSVRPRLSLSEIVPQMRVAYVPAHAEWDKDSIEYGTVSSKNDKYVFVKFDKQLAKFGWDGTTSQSCDPNDLEAV